MIDNYVEKLKSLEIEELWANRVKDKANDEIFDVIGIEWSCKEIGFGRYELLIKSDGTIAAETEHMDKQDDLTFTNAIMDALKKYVLENVKIAD
jgi:hypothetical protein